MAGAVAAQLTATAPGAAQVGEGLATLPPGADSSELVSRAREAQRRFESMRVRHLPVTLGWGSSACDDEVGRMCWRHDTGGSWMPEPDPPEVAEARRELLATLEGVAREVPGDPWVLGQRVWYLGEAGRWEEATEVARACGPPGTWWCDALEGLGLHRTGRYEAALGSFERALGAMGPERAGAWLDPGDLLDGDARDALERAREEGVERAFLERLWSLSDPLWIHPGNDRLTEHLARRTVAVVREEARNPHGISWGRDLEELLVRYGWEVGWERVESSPASILDRRGVVGHEHPESRSFVPPGRVLERPLDVEPDAWVPGLAYARSAYAPAYAPVFLPAPSTVSVVPLGDSVAILATFILPEDTTRRTREGLRAPFVPLPGVGSGAVAGLALRGPDGDPGPSATVHGVTRGGLMVTTPPGDRVVSVEVWDRDAGLAGRHRVAVEAPAVPPGVVSLSDLLLLEIGPEPGSLEDAVPRLLLDERREPGDSLRVAWVVAGLGHWEETLSYRLSVRKADRGFFRRAGEWLGLVDRDEPLRLAWEEAGPGEPGPVLRSVAVTLPGYSPGIYSLRLELATPGRGTVVSERRVEVVAGPGSLR